MLATTSVRAPSLWSLPSVIGVTLIIALLLVSGAVQRAISIDSDQVPATKSESNPIAAPATVQTAQTTTSTTRQPQMTKVPQSTGASSAATVASGRKGTSQQQQAVASQQQANRQQNGRVRRPTQQAASATTATRASGLINHRHDQEPSETQDPLQEEIKRLMAEYSNTPPLFVTTTRDFFVDVARYPLGFKLATMQALDSEGDRIEYSLKPASYRDASPYFTINATSGELRLANRRIPLQVELGEPLPAASISGDSDKTTTTTAEDGGEDDDTDEQQDSGQALAADLLANGDSNRQLARGAQESAVASSLEKPGFLYFLNVAANDGKYTSVVELQIHVFNSSSFGTKSPVQLTIEGGRRGGESLMSAKTSEFFDRLYRPLGARNQAATNNSTLVFPSFVNPGLAAPNSLASATQDDELSAAPSTTTAATPTVQLLDNELGANSPLPNLSARFVSEQAAHYTEASNSPRRVDAVMQQPMVLSLVISICSCFVVALVLLIFVLPLSVKRLKRRLKRMELQHEQLSQKASSTGGSSIVCSSANSIHSGSSLTTGSGVGSSHLPSSLSQFTLSGSERVCAMLHMPDQHQRHQPLGRQSSLDSAITSNGAGHFAATNSTLSYQTQLRYQPPQLDPNFNHHQQQQQHQNQHQQQQQLLTNGLNRINNGAIVNPIYLHSQSAAQVIAQQQPQLQHSNDLNNIYCPIDDDFYSTINNDTETTTITPNGMIVGQTCDSRNYFASQCAPTFHQPAPALAQQQQQQQQQQMTACNNQLEQQRDSDSPPSRSSSRSSTRSLSRFLSLPARHWSHQQQQNEGNEHDDGERKRKSSFLDELEYHLNRPNATLQHPAANTKMTTSQTAQTIARSNHISQEQLARNNKRPRRPTKEAHVWELERHRLKFLDILDEGQFGLVWRCKLKPQETTSSGDLERTVAVKTLKSFAAKDEREREELLAEIEIMKGVCEHPNVVKMLHCCTRDISQSKPILLVMEHVELGKLKSFLEKSRASRDYATTSSLYNHASQSLQGETEYLGYDDDEELESSVYDATSGNGDGDNDGLRTSSGQHPARRQRQLTSRELITFIYHIAKGMEYISSNSIVHRDLASRNILISAQRVCKIGDFGMARHVASSGDVYERRSRNAKIPVRWMAPEVLLSNLFTTKSDVFSFGILMWEIVTLGSTPYAHLKMEQIIEAVARAGERPSKPDYCHSQLYSIMSKCWSAEPDERPSFSELVHQLDELLLSTNEYIMLDQYPDHNYYNITAAPGELV